VDKELQVVKCSNFLVQKYEKRVSQRKGCDVEMLIVDIIIIIIIIIISFYPR